mgnify:FL=1
MSHPLPAGDWKPRTVPPPPDARPVETLAACLAQWAGSAPGIDWCGPPLSGAPAAGAHEPARDCLARTEDWLAGRLAAAARRTGTPAPLPLLHDPHGQVPWRAADLLASAAARGAQGLILETAPSHSPLAHPLQSHTPEGVHVYTPAFSGELAALLTHAMTRWTQGLPIGLMCIRVLPHTLPSPDLPRSFAAGIVRGLYLLVADAAERAVRLQLLASGASLAPALDAALVLRERHGLAVDVWSVTSYAGTLRAAQTAGTSPDAAGLAAQMAHSHGPILAVADAPRSVPETWRSLLPPTRPFEALGWDDTHPAGPVGWHGGGPAGAQRIVDRALAVCESEARHQADDRQRHWASIASTASI